MTDAALIERVEGAEGPLKAFAVLEQFENTGGIVFAKSSVAARRIGANQYADDDFSNVSCRRAPWADEYDGKPVPVSLMIENGWHFECGGCGSRIDDDYLYETGRYPEDVIGFEHTSAFCDSVCEARDKLEVAERKKLELRWLRRFAKIIKARFPDAEPEHRHAYATRLADGRLIISQVTVEFGFPGMEYGKASLTWQRKDSWGTVYPKPHYTCASGDKEAFEAYAALRAKGRADG